jgi:hypothetical protein
MLAAYGVDVLDPSVSLRRISVLLDRLPPAARQSGEVWSLEAELLALVCDHLANLTYVTLRAAGAKNPPRPKPLPRPRPRAAEPSGAVLGPSTGQPGPAAPGPDGWLAAAHQLALMPGVQVDHG